MPPELFNSPEKQWVRQRLWLPAVQTLHKQLSTEIKFLTFAGPKGHDIDLFAVRKKLLKIENIRVWESNAGNAENLRTRYGLTLKIKVGEAFNLCTAKDERSFFPFHLINLDYTSGAFHVDKPRSLPTKLETVQAIIKQQQDHATSFMLFFAIAAKSDVDNEFGKLFLHKAAFDLAKRLGITQPLFNLTREPDKTYSEILASIVPCMIIRMGIEQGFDTQCVTKAVYRPYRSTKTTILCFIFTFDHEHPTLTLSTLQTMQGADAIIDRRQQEACAMNVIDVNSRIRRRRIKKK